MMMELRQLRYLVAVVEEAHFTRAAEKVYVSQSALSQQIQALEQEVGTLLLDRSKRGVRLTAAGEILYRHALRIFNELAQAQMAIQELENLERGELRVGVVQTVNDYFMPPLVSAFAGAHPGVKLYVDELPSDDIEAGLDAGTLQVGLSFIPAANPSLDADPLFDEELVLIVHRDHALADRRDVQVKALDAMPMVMLSKTFCTRRLWEDNARLAGAQPQIVMEMNTVSSILAVVEKSGLATVLPKHTIAETRSQSLVSLTLSDPTPSRRVGVLWSHDNYLCSASRTFITSAQKFAAWLATTPP